MSPAGRGYSGMAEEIRNLSTSLAQPDFGSHYNLTAYTEFGYDYGNPNLPVA